MTEIGEGGETPQFYEYVDGPFIVQVFSTLSEVEPMATTYLVSLISDKYFGTDEIEYELSLGLPVDITASQYQKSLWMTHASTIPGEEEIKPTLLRGYVPGIDSELSYMSDTKKIDDAEQTARDKEKAKFERYYRILRSAGQSALLQRVSVAVIDENGQVEKPDTWEAASHLKQIPTEV